MSKTTTNLGLYEVDPTTDGALTFDIKTMLNDNFDKIDAVTGSASAISKGIVKIGSGISVDGNGVISVPTVTVPVSSVNAKTGAVILVPSDIGAATAAQGTLATNAIPTSQKGAAGGVALYDTVTAHLEEEAQLNAQWDAKDLTLVSGVLTTDALCWLGKNAQYTQPATGMALATVANVTYNLLRFGHYSVGFRLKCSNITSVTAVTTLKILTATGSVVASLPILGTDFAVVGANIYKTFYVPFDNTGQSTGNAFTFAFTSEAVASAVVAVDSILVAPIHLANHG